MIVLFKPADRRCFSMPVHHWSPTINQSWGYNVKCENALHPLVYSSTPHPQWSSGYDFRLSLTPTSRGRPGFDSLLRSISGSDSSSISPSSGAGSPASSNYFFLFPPNVICRYLLLTSDAKSLRYIGEIQQHSASSFSHEDQLLHRQQPTSNLVPIHPVSYTHLTLPTKRIV